MIVFVLVKIGIELAGSRETRLFAISCARLSKLFFIEITRI